MNDRAAPPERPRSSRRRYYAFVRDYKEQKLDQTDEADKPKSPETSANGDGEPTKQESEAKSRGKRREYLREYLRWLKPHRWAVGTLIVIALVGAGFEMIEPLFMRFMVDGLIT